MFLKTYTVWTEYLKGTIGDCTFYKIKYYPILFTTFAQIIRRDPQNFIKKEVNIYEKHSTHQQHIQQNRWLQRLSKLSLNPNYTFLPQKLISLDTKNSAFFQHPYLLLTVLFGCKRNSVISSALLARVIRCWAFIPPSTPRYMPTMMIFNFQFMIFIVMNWPLRVIVQLHGTFAKMICLNIVKVSYCFIIICICFESRTEKFRKYS